MNKLISEIASIQGISIKHYARVRCPDCNTKTMYIELEGNIGECVLCHKRIAVDEIHQLAQSNYIDSHKASDYQMKQNRGIE